MSASSPGPTTPRRCLGIVAFVADDLAPDGLRLGDAAVVVIVAALLVGGAVAISGRDGQATLTLGGARLLAASAFPLLWRRRYPVAATLVTGALTATYGVAELPDPPFPLALIVAVYSLALGRSRAVSWACAGTVAVSVPIAFALAGDSGVDDYYRNLIPTLAALAIGDQVRERMRSDQRRRGADLDSAVRSERDRIARELHDTVAHHVGMVVVQAEAGAAGLDAAGDHAGATRFDEISGSARDALGELRLLLDVLRDTDDGPGTAPQPGLADLPALVERVRSAGVPVELIEEGTRCPLPAGTDLAAYRITQEALTNVVRHAGPVPTRVVVRWSAPDLTLEVHDDGGPAVASSAGAGRGLVGIRERVALLGGYAAIGPRPGGGFAVCVTLPLTGSGT